MIKVNAIGDACPIPVVKTKNAIRELQGGGTVETLVDNEIAVQNLTKMANQKGYDVHSDMIMPICGGALSAQIRWETAKKNLEKLY